MARLVVIVGFDGVQGLDLCGPMDVFAGAQQLVEGTGLSDPGYKIVVVSAAGAPVRTSAGLTLMPEAALADIVGPIDT